MSNIGIIMYTNTYTFLNLKHSDISSLQQLISLKVWFLRGCCAHQMDEHLALLNWNCWEVYIVLWNLGWAVDRYNELRTFHKPCLTGYPWPPFLLLFICSVLSDFVKPWPEACQASLSFTITQSFLKLISIESMMTSQHLIFCHPVLLLPSIFPSIRVFFNEPVLCIRWQNYWSFSFSISPSNKYSGLLSFRIYWFGLLAVQGTLKSLFQHYSSKASVFWCSTFSWSNSHICTWLLEKNITLTICKFVDQVMSLLFNMVSRFSSKQQVYFLILWLQSPSAMILSSRK